MSELIVSPNDVPPNDATRNQPHSEADSNLLRPKVLYLGGTHDGLIDLRGHLGDDVEIVEVRSPVRVVSELSRNDEDYVAVYCDADHFLSVAPNAKSAVSPENVVFTIEQYHPIR